MSQRLDRINELLRREISTIVQRDFEFDGALVTIRAVEITQDLRDQSRVAKRVVLRCTPVLDFRLDTSAARGVDMINVLDEVDKLPKAPPLEEEDGEDA